MKLLCVPISYCIEKLRVMFTTNGKRQFQVENFSK